MSLETEMAQFDLARKLYQGTKRGNETEFKDFCKHKDWEKVLPLLLPAIQMQIKVRQAMKRRGEFVPVWKNFKTWLHQRCWEEEYPQADKFVREKQPEPKRIYKDGIAQPLPATHAQIGDVMKRLADNGNSFIKRLLEKR